LIDARAAADRLGLAFGYLVTGYGGLAHSLKIVNQGKMVWQS
jgi:hypothetical protein